MPMTELAPRKIKAAERRLEIIQDRADGMTFKKLAAKYEVSMRRVRQLVKESFDRCLTSSNELVEEILEKQMAHLEELREAVWDDALEGDIKAGAQALAIIDRECRLVGVDAPTKHVFHGHMLNQNQDLEAQAQQLGFNLDQLRGPAAPLQLAVKVVEDDQQKDPLEASRGSLEP